MRFADTSRNRPYAKDPAVVRFHDRYFLYYSVPPYKDGRTPDGWGIGIAQSANLDQWTKIGEVQTEQDCERNGLCAPGAIVHNNQVHLFYQTYGNGPKDAICHAVSDDGIHFVRNPTNPIFAPTGTWNCARAIDADVVVFQNELWMYIATRDPDFKIQMLGVATAPVDSDFACDKWTQRCDASILKPELPWEQECIEAPAVILRNDKLYMFYAGAYNNKPQQIGLAISSNGLHWVRHANEPVLPNGDADSWYASEAGHPYAFVDKDGSTHLFFQGNNDNGKSWYLSRAVVSWVGDDPVIDLHDAP